MFKAILTALGVRKHDVVEVAWEKRIAEALREAGFPSQIEVVLGDQSRVDILMDYYAVEIDWAPKWAESIGQSLYYAIRTKRKPAIILLFEEGKNNQLYSSRAAIVAGNLTPKVAVWTFDVKTKVLDMDGALIQVR
mgnify:CR=1 FL=1